MNKDCNVISLCNTIIVFFMSGVEMLIMMIKKGKCVQGSMCLSSLVSRFVGMAVTSG